MLHTFGRDLFLRHTKDHSALKPVLVGQAPENLDKRSHQTRPARLMTRAKPGAVVAMEIFIEQDVITPVRITLELLGTAYTGRRPSRSRKNMDVSLRAIFRLTSNRFMYVPDPIGHSTLKASP